MTKIKCPSRTCGSTQCIPIVTNKKFSLGKAIVGGGIGAMINPLVGAVGVASGIKGKKGKTTFMCQSCGNVFEKKI